MNWNKDFPQIKNIESEKNMNEEIKNTKKPWSNSKRAMIMFVGFGMLLVTFAVMAIGK